MPAARNRRTAHLAVGIGAWYLELFWCLVFGASIASVCVGPIAVRETCPEGLAARRKTRCRPGTGLTSSIGPGEKAFPPAPSRRLQPGGHPCPFDRPARRVNWRPG